MAAASGIAQEFRITKYGIIRARSIRVYTAQYKEASIWEDFLKLSKVLVIKMK